MLTDNAAGSISPPVPQILSYKFFFHIILIIIAISICYSNTLHQEWHFDDNPNIVTNEKIHLHEFTTENIIKTFYSRRYHENKLYRPLSCFSFSINYYFSRLNTFGYHVTNICIHILSAIFAYLIFLKILLIMKDKGYAAFHSVSCHDIALLGAVFWAIHPIQTQAVTYIVQRMTSLSAMFYMMSIFFYILFRQNKNFVKKVVYICLVILCAISGVLSKENAVLIPAGIILFEITFLTLNFNYKKHLITGILIFSILSIIFFFIFNENFSEKIIKLYDTRPFTMGQRLLTEPRILFQYLLLILCPVSDFLHHESDILPSINLLKPVTTLFSMLFLFLIITFSIIFLKRFRLFCFAILFYFLNHLIESSFIGLELYFEHRNYLPSIFLYLAMAYYLIKGIELYKVQNKKIMQGLIVTLITALVISKGNATYLRNDIWQSEKSLMIDAIGKSPANIRPLISLASLYIGSKEYDKATEMLKKAEDIFKADTKQVQDNWVGILYYNAAIIQIRKDGGSNEKAIHYLIESLKYTTGDWQVHSNLGYLFFKKNDIKNSLISYFNAYQLKNDEPRLINMYGRALYENKQITHALGAFKNGLKIKDLEIIRFNIVGCYLKQGDELSAKREFYKIKRPSDFLNISSINYLIYKSVLFDGKPEALAIKNMALLLFKTQADLCEWLEKMKKNHEPGIIYPDISPIEDNLIKEYISLLNSAGKQIGASIQNIKECSKIPDK